MKILVGISGAIGVLGIHTYLVRLSAEREVELQVVMTPTAARFVSAEALAALLGSTVLTEAWGPGLTRPPPALVEGVDVYLVAPASANTLARCANGIADSLVTTCYLCHTGPTVFAPAMAPEMLHHPATVRNIDRLREYGALILPTARGVQAATGKILDGALCEYGQMWEALVRSARWPAAPAMPVQELVHGEP
ncbi:flavoprotein [Sorangium sp. So ce367]|uniref:flavoprotein n=1 Tax=Sorangium sp. So ce367 TaxID=3133305 RepID=UPI003F5E2609